jgi:hypothetical protein
MLCDAFGDLDTGAHGRLPRLRQQKINGKHIFHDYLTGRAMPSR